MTVDIIDTYTVRFLFTYAKHLKEKKYLSQIINAFWYHCTKTDWGKQLH